MPKADLERFFRFAEMTQRRPLLSESLDSEFLRVAHGERGDAGIRRAVKILFDSFDGAPLQPEQELFIAAEGLIRCLALDVWNVSNFRNDSTFLPALTVMHINIAVSRMISMIVTKYSSILRLVSKGPVTLLADSFPSAHEAVISLRRKMDNCFQLAVKDFRAAEAPGRPIHSSDVGQILDELGRNEVVPFMIFYSERMLLSFGAWISTIDVPLLQSLVVLESESAINQLRRSTAPDRRVNATVVPCTPPMVRKNTIRYLGNSSFQINQSEPVSVTPTETAILKAFFSVAALSLKDLQKKSLVDSPHKILSKLRTKYNGVFNVAISMAEGSGKGGYKVRIQDHSELSTKRPVLPQ